MRSLALAFVLLAAGLEAQGHPFDAALVIEGPKLFTATSVVMDVDLDGQKDLILANAFPLDIERRPAYCYRLDERLRFSALEDVPPTEELGIVSYPAIAKIDVDGDRYEDLVSISTVGGITVHRNRGIHWNPALRSRFESKPGLYRFSVLGSSASPQPFHGLTCTGIAVDDFDGDGNLDIAVSGEVRVLFDVVASLGITILPGDGKGNFVSEHRVLMGRYLDMRVADVDHDGDPDLIGIDDSGRLCVGRNRGSFRFSTSFFQMPVLHRRHRLEIADVTGDGNVDYLVAGLDHREPRIILLPGDEKGLPGTASLIQIDRRDYMEVEGMVVDDFDGDGHPDLAVLLGSEVERASLNYMRGLPGGKLATPAVIQLDSMIAVADTPYVLGMLQSEDLDGDLRPELLIHSVKNMSSERICSFVFRNKAKGERGYWKEGDSTKGSNGLAPCIGLLGGKPRLGNERFALSVRGLLPAQLGVLVFDSRWWDYDLGGVRWHCYPTFAIGFLSEDGAGESSALIPLAVPEDPRTLIPTWTLQAIAFDTDAPNPMGIAASSALRLRFARR